MLPFLILPLIFLQFQHISYLQLVLLLPFLLVLLLPFLLVLLLPFLLVLLLPFLLVLLLLLPFIQAAYTPVAAPKMHSTLQTGPNTTRSHWTNYTNQRFDPILNEYYFDWRHRYFPDILGFYQVFCPQSWHTDCSCSSPLPFL